MKTSLGFGTILFLIFLVLKLTNHIDWSWVWVFAPLVISGVFWMCAFAALFVALYIFGPS